MPNAKSLSARDQAILDALTAGESRGAIAERHGISEPRVSQIRHSPAGVAYLNRRGTDNRALLFARTSAELLQRLDWGGVKMADLIAVWKAAMPQELTVKRDEAEINEAAERLSRDVGIPKDQAIRDIRDHMKRVG